MFPKWQAWKEQALLARAIWSCSWGWAGPVIWAGWGFDSPRFLRWDNPLVWGTTACSMTACVRAVYLRVWYWCRLLFVFVFVFVLLFVCFLFLFFIFIYFLLSVFVHAVRMYCAYEHTCLRVSIPAYSMPTHVRDVYLRVWCWCRLLFVFVFVLLFFCF